MAHPFCPPTIAAFRAGVCDSVGCTSGRDALILHHVCHNGKLRRLCSSCVLLCHPAAFCSACLFLLSPDASAAVCSRCGDFAAHLSCVPCPSFFVCPRCAAAAQHRPFSYDPAAGGARRALDERAARVLLIAAHLAHDSVTRAAAEAREVGEHRAQEAVTARRRSRDALDVAFRAMEAEAEADKLGSSEQTKKQAIPKKSEASRYMVDAFKFNATQQPAAPAFAAAAAAARSMPSSRELGIEEARVATAAAVTRDDDWRSTLFGRLQS